MSNDKRERQRANRMERLDEATRSEARGRRTHLIIRWGVIVVVALGAALAYSLLTSDENGNVVADASETTLPSPADAALANRPDCPAADGSSPRTITFEAPPKLCIDAEVIYAADFVTSEGDFTAILDPQLDPASVNNFIVLAQYHAYDGTIFHRVINDFVIQGGDLENRFGRGGPGYNFTGAFPPEDEPFVVGSLAMANRGNPSTNSSQFFIITGAAGANLGQNYSLMGRVTDGLDVAVAVQQTPTEVRDIEGAPASDVPVTDVTIETVTIRTATDDEVNEYEGE